MIQLVPNADQQDCGDVVHSALGGLPLARNNHESTGEIGGQLHQVLKDLVSLWWNQRYAGPQGSWFRRRLGERRVTLDPRAVLAQAGQRCRVLFHRPFIGSRCSIVTTQSPPILQYPAAPEAHHIPRISAEQDCCMDATNMHGSN